MRIIKTAFLSLIISSFLYSQTADEAISLLENEHGFGLKATAMGGAFVSVADDISALYWNPAGLAQIDDTGISATIMHNSHNHKTQLYNTLTDESRGYTGLQNFGLVFPFPVARGSFVIAMGYHQVNNQDNFTYMSGLHPSDKIEESFDIENTGGLDQWSFGAAIDLSRNFSAGVSVNFIGGSRDYNYTYTDSDVNDLFTYYKQIRKDNVTFDYSGLNVEAGGLFHLTDFLNLGATITFPYSITVNENWAVREDDLYDSVADSFYTESGEFEYKIDVPFKFALGLSYQAHNLTLSSSLTYQDWAQTKYDAPNSDDRNSDNYLDLLAENNVIRQDYKSTVTWAFGAEYIIPSSDVAIRAGYRYHPTSLKNATKVKDVVGGRSVESFLFDVNTFDRQYISAGLSYTIDNRTSLDFSYRLGRWNEVNIYNNPIYDEYVETIDEKTASTMLFGLKYSF